jgi:hypothetical protein
LLFQRRLHIAKVLGHAKLEGVERMLLNRNTGARREQLGSVHEHRDMEEYLPTVQRIVLDAAGSSRFLIVLDDVWSPDLLKMTREVCGNEGFILFSARNGKFAGEIGAPRIGIGDMMPQMAEGPFLRWAGMFTSDGSDSAAVAQIVDLCGQLAITLTVACSIIATTYDKNLEMLIEQIRQCKYMSSSVPKRDPTENKTLGFIISISTDELKGNELAAFLNLGALPPRVIVPQAALSKTWGMKMGNADFRRVCNALSSRALLQFSEDGRATATIHDTVRDYTR